jgi:hypothetical protein
MVADSTPFNFYVYEGADRGAKIMISNSNFKHSQFCKGMIVYRVVPLITKSQAFLNMTDLYMKNTQLNKSDSFILIKDSTFLNMNAYSSVEALALPGSKPFLKSYHGKDTFHMPYFFHKGIILNLEDFPGRVEVRDSTFEKNAHYVPQILYNASSTSEVYSIESFTDR